MLKLQLLSYGYFVLHSLSYNIIYLATRPLAFGNADDGLLLAAVCGRCLETASMSGFEDFTLKFSELKQFLNFTLNELHSFGPEAYLFGTDVSCTFRLIILSKRDLIFCE